MTITGKICICILLLFPLFLKGQTKGISNCTYLKTTLELEELNKHFKICENQTPLTIIDTSKYFKNCDFESCNRMIHIKDTLSFAIDFRAKGPKNTLFLKKSVRSNSLILNFFNPSNNKAATVEIQNYGSSKPVYIVTDVGVF